MHAALGQAGSCENPLKAAIMLLHIRVFFVIAKLQTQVNRYASRWLKSTMW
jgi:hypothetical protein